MWNSTLLNSCCIPVEVLETVKEDNENDESINPYSN